MAVEVTRAGAILAVADFERSLAFYRDRLGLEVEALYDDPPYATLVCAGARVSLAEQGHPAEVGRCPRPRPRLRPFPGGGRVGDPHA